MASLTDASILSRKIIRYGIYLVIAVIIGRFLFQGALALYRQAFPPPEPKPTVAFGNLPKIAFPEKGKPEGLTFLLQTVDGNLPTIQTQAEVYGIVQPQRSLQALDEAKALAGDLGFSPGGRPLIESIPNIYLFTKNSPASLTMNVTNKTFSVSYDLTANPGVLEGIPLSPDQAIGKASDYFGMMPNATDLEGQKKTEFLAIVGGVFSPAISQSDAQITKVNIFRKNYGQGDKIPAVTQNMPEANVWAMYSGNRGELVAAEYHHFTVDTKKVGTYPLKTTAEAWDELQKGDPDSYIANVGTSGQTIIIRKVYLAYYDPGTYLDYYQPVIVFEGDNDFYGYIPAVMKSVYGKE